MATIDGENIREYRDDWALALMEQGVIVKLNIYRWRGTTKLNYEELGISFNDPDSHEFMNKYIQLGYEKLLPPKISNEIKAIESIARTNLATYSFNTLWGKFVPYTSFQEWKVQNDEIKEKYIDISRYMGEHYDEIVSEVKEEYEKMGTDVWQRANNSTDLPPRSFLEHFTSRIISKIPSREEIVLSFKYETIFFSIPLPSLVEEEIIKIEKIMMEREQIVEEHEQKLQSKRMIAEEYRVRKREMIDSFLESTVCCLRQNISELADHIYSTLQKDEKDISITHVKKIKRMISNVKCLNFHNDKEMEDILSELEIEVSKYKGDRDKNIISKKLSNLVDLAKEEYTPDGFNPMFS